MNTNDELSAENEELSADNTIHREEALAKYIAKKEPGEIVQSGEIEEIGHVKYATSKFYGLMAKTKRILLEQHKILLVSIHSKGGYQIGYPSDHAKEARRETEKARNAIRRGKKIMDYAPTERMSQPELQECENVKGFLVRAEAIANGGVTEVRMLSNRKPHPFEMAFSGRA